MIRRLVVAVALAAAMFSAAPSGAGEPPPPPTEKPIWMTRACAYDDSPQCYWNAGESGNNKGYSFYAVRVGRDVCVLYIDHHHSRTHNYCKREN